MLLRLARRVADHLDGHGGGRVFVAPLDVVLSTGDVLRPDLVFIAEGDLDDPVVLRPPDAAKPLRPSGLAIDLSYIFRR